MEYMRVAEDVIAAQVGDTFKDHDGKQRKVIGVLLDAELAMAVKDSGLISRARRELAFMTVCSLEELASRQLEETANVYRMLHGVDPELSRSVRGRLGTTVMVETVLREGHEDRLVFTEELETRPASVPSLVAAKMPARIVMSLTVDTNRTFTHEVDYTNVAYLGPDQRYVPGSKIVLLIKGVSEVAYPIERLVRVEF